MITKPMVVGMVWWGGVEKDVDDDEEESLSLREGESEVAVCG